MNERQRLWLGSVLVLLQFGLLAVLALLAWPAVEQWHIPPVAWAATVAAVLLAAWAFSANRPGNFNIHPRPRVGGTLVTSGPYGWIRHPMYTAFLLGTWALAWTAASDEAWLAWWTLSLVLWFNLETAVGHARVGRHGVGWEGARTQQARACKDEQRAQRAPGRLNRVWSALTQQVNSVVVNNISIHANLQRRTSGQLRFLGSSPRWKSAGCWRSIRGMRITGSRRSGLCLGCTDFQR